MKQKPAGAKRKGKDFGMEGSHDVARTRGPQFAPCSNPRDSVPPIHGVEPSRRLHARAQVRHLVELQAPDMFEVSLAGRRMLPLVKRLVEFEALAQQLQTPMHNVAHQPPALAAQHLQAFLDHLLAVIGIDEKDTTPSCQQLLSFLGLRNGDDAPLAWLGSPDGSPQTSQSRLGKVHCRAEGHAALPRCPLQPLHNQARYFALPPPPLDCIGEAPSSDERAAALEIIRQRRQTARAAREAAPAHVLMPQNTRSHSRSLLLPAEEQAAQAVPQKMLDELTEPAAVASKIQDSQTDCCRVRTVTGEDSASALEQFPEMSTAGYAASLGSKEDTFSVHGHVPGKSVSRRALRQAQALLEQFDADSKLKTWVGTGEEESGLTFTLSLTGESVFDISVPKISVAGAKMPTTSPRACDGIAPAPMESNTTTSNRVATMAGYTSNFRDIRSKFANAASSISDQEYASSLLVMPEVQIRLQGEQDRFRPSLEVFTYLLGVVSHGDPDGQPCIDNKTLRARAGVVMCNLCLESAKNREMIVSAGAIESLTSSLEQAVNDEDYLMQAVASACLANLAADRVNKDAIMQSSAVQSLQHVLCCCDKAAAVEAAGAFWSLCVDNTPEAKSTLATSEAVKALVKMLESDDTEVLTRACGALSEICICNQSLKTKISNAGAFPCLSKLLSADVPGTYTGVTIQRLAACALCNLVANHPGNKRMARRLSVIQDLATLLKKTEVVETQNACASCIFNLVCKTDKDTLEALEILPTLRSIKSTARMIDTRLLCATSNAAEVASPAFGAAFAAF